MKAMAEVPEIIYGYSPKPVRTPSLDDPSSPSDSNDPDTNSPNGLLDGPDLTGGKPSIPNTGEFSVDDGIVTFAK